MKCPKFIRWLCGDRTQKQSVRVKINQLNEQRAASLDATKRLRRESIRSVLYPERPDGVAPP